MTLGPKRTYCVNTVPLIAISISIPYCIVVYLFIYLFTCLQESDYFTQNGEFRVDSAGSPTLLNCLMYKMCYFRFGEIQVDISNIKYYLVCGQISFYLY